MTETNEKLPLIYDGSYIGDYREQFKCIMVIPSACAKALVEETYEIDESRKDTFGFVNKMFLFVPKGEHDFDFEEYQEKKTRGTYSGGGVKAFENPFKYAKPGMICIYLHDFRWYLYEYIGHFVDRNVLGD